MGSFSRVPTEPSHLRVSSILHIGVLVRGRLLISSSSTVEVGFRPKVTGGVVGVYVVSLPIRYSAVRHVILDMGVGSLLLGFCRRR